MPPSGQPPTRARAASTPVETATIARAAWPAIDTDTDTDTTTAAADCGEGEAASAASDEAEGEAGVPEEIESRVATSSAAVVEPRYTLDLSDAELERRWRTAIESLGSISIGFADEGRLINARPFPRGSDEAWTLITPNESWGTTETIDYLLATADRVKRLHPTAQPLRVNNISAQDGGYLRPHRSHQTGRDVDLGFYYPTPMPRMIREREQVIDIAPNWELIKSLVMLTDVQLILVDQRVQRVLYDYALAIGEDPAWLDSLFRAGPASIVQHARRHRDHFHVRFYNPRAQELGRRVAPLLAERPEQNLVIVRVKQGDTLSGIAVKYQSSVRAIQKASRLRGTFLRLRQVLRVPIRGPCTRCPVPPPVIVPPRKVPPPLAMEPPILATTTSTRSESALAIE
ncbi:MAG: penicillin-insensitive murein endopeptidase [Deltaproteobacteria bacterium]|nr:penicillin-insensitive murein endopeptidase [Deltaproteobacteria bacterium]